MFGCARRGASGALIPKSALCGAEFPPEGLKLKSQEVILTGRRPPHGPALRQVRKEAAISDAVCVVDVSGHVYGLWILEKDSMEGAQPCLPNRIFLVDTRTFSLFKTAFPSP